MCVTDRQTDGIAMAVADLRLYAQSVGTFAHAMIASEDFYFISRYTNLLYYCEFLTLGSINLRR